jgi:predicted MPP superfamily phosphohydrolase
MARARARAPAVSSDVVAELPRVESTQSSSERINVEITDGSAICFSDCHYDPDAPPSTAHRAVVQFAKSLSPDLLICGGDALDWAGLSTKHARIMWEDRPSPVAELAIGQKRLHEIEMASPKSRRLFTLGNHDQRLATYPSQNAPMLEGLHGTRLEDFFPT